MQDALRRPRLLLLAACLAVVSSERAFAQAIDATKVGAINVSYVARTCRLGKEGLARIDEASRKKAAEVEAKASELQSAQAAAQKALALHTPEPAFYYHAGMIAAALGNNADALARWSRVQDLNLDFDPLQGARLRRALAVR